VRLHRGVRQAVPGNAGLRCVVLDCRVQVASPELCTAQTSQTTASPAPQTGGYGDYWHVFVHYCSSDTWSGTRPASEETGGYTFHGRHIFDAVMSDLALNFGLLEASHIILTGGSAGAQGVMYNCDHFSSWVWQTNPGLDVRCVANAPEFYPAEVHTEDCYSRAPDYQNFLTEFWARQADQSCLEFAATEAVENVGELCGVTSRFAQFVTTPLMVLSSHEDSVFTSAFGCAPKLGTPEYEAFRTEWMAAHSLDVTRLQVEFPEIAFFAPNCRLHGLGNWNGTVEESETGEQVRTGSDLSDQHHCDGSLSSFLKISFCSKHLEKSKIKKIE